MKERLVSIDEPVRMWSDCPVTHTHTVGGREISQCDINAPDGCRAETVWVERRGQFSRSIHAAYMPGLTPEEREREIIDQAMWLDIGLKDQIERFARP